MVLAPGGVTKVAWMSPKVLLSRTCLLQYNKFYSTNCRQVPYLRLDKARGVGTDGAEGWIKCERRIRSWELRLQTSGVLKLLIMKLAW